MARELPGNLLRPLIILMVAAALAGCSAKAPRYSLGLTNTLKGWDAPQIGAYRVYYQGSPRSPRGVVLDDPQTGVRFIAKGWIRVEGTESVDVVRTALDTGLKVAPLVSRSGVALGYLISEDVETPSEFRVYRLVAGTGPDSELTYSVVYLKFPNPAEYGNGDHGGH